MGLGLLGRGVRDVRFLAEKGANLIVTDLKTEDELADSLAQLKGFENIQYVLGEHRLEDFWNRDMILKAAGVPLNSVYIAEARKNGIPIEMDESLFMKLAEDVIVIGITGTRGKTTTTHCIYEILKTALRRNSEQAEKTVHLAGNIQDIATLPLLDVIKPGDYIVCELSSWQLQGFGEDQMSPHIAVFTNFMPDHLNYYQGNMDAYFADKANIFQYQNEKDYLVLGEEVSKDVQARFGYIKSNVFVVGKSNVPKEWNIKIPGEHNLENISQAVKVAEILGINAEVIKKAIEDFQGVKNRLDLIQEMNGIKIYNDTTATTPEATLAGLKALSQNQNVVLIMGGQDKGLNTNKLIDSLDVYCKAIVLLAGNGTKKIRAAVHNLQFKNIAIDESEALDDAVAKALGYAEEGDIILFSPAFASFGMFKNEFDRGEQFCQIARRLKIR